MKTCYIGKFSDIFEDAYEHYRLFTSVYTGKEYGYVFESFDNNVDFEDHLKDLQDKYQGRINFRFPLKGQHNKELYQLYDLKPLDEEMLSYLRENYNLKI